MQPHAYVHRVHYYETDKMGIVHHSNYIRWMEEARVDLLDRLGIGFASMEALGILSPVVEVRCRYLHPCCFDQRITVLVWVEEFRGVRLRIGYRMEDDAGRIVAEGASEHCFTDAAGRPLILRKRYPEIDAVLASAAAPAP